MRKNIHSLNIQITRARFPESYFSGIRGFYYLYYLVRQQPMWMKFKTAISVLLFLMMNIAHAQPKFRVVKLNSDSLVALISGKEGTGKVDAFNLLSNTMCREDIDSSISLAMQAIKLSREQNYKKGLADGYFNVGNAYYLLDTLEPTISNYMKAYRIYEELGPSEWYGNLCLQIAAINWLTGMDEFVMSYVYQAKSIFESIDDREGMYNTYFSLAIGNCTLAPIEIDSANYFYQKAMNFLDPDKDQNYLAILHRDIGINFRNQFYETNDTSYLTKSLSWFYKALNIPEITDRYKIWFLWEVMHLWNEINTQSGSDSADACLQRIRYLKENGETGPDSIPDLYMVLSCLDTAKFLYRQGDIEQDIIELKRVLAKVESWLSGFSANDYIDPAHGLNAKYYLKVKKEEILHYLYEEYSDTRNFEEALENFKLAKQAEEEIFLKKNQDYITVLETAAKDEKAKNRIDLLARDNEMKEMQVRQSRALNFGIAGLFIILILIGLLFLRQKRMQAEHKSVILEQKLLRLQMNPHFIFNALSNILNFVNRKENENAANYLTSFSRLLRTTLESSREDYILLKDEISSIKNYLDLQLLRYAGKFEYSIEVDEAIDIENSIIPPMLIQPFIENAIEHGIKHKQEKGNIFIRFRLENKKVICEIEDDGVGRKKAWETEYQKQKPHKSLATEIINDRIHSINKKLKQKISLAIIDKTSESNQASGTLVRLDLPYLLD